jgi:TonB family protein
MATITMMPPTHDILEAHDAIDIIDIKAIKTKSLTKLKTNISPATLNVKPKKIDYLSVLKTNIFSDINNEQSRLVENIAMKDPPLIPTNFQSDLVKTINKENLDSKVLEPLYPYDAYRNNINGWVILKLFISKIGKVVDVEVLGSSPKGVFENTAIKMALKKEFPIDKNNPDPKAYTKNINIKYGVAD